MTASSKTRAASRAARAATAPPHGGTASNQAAATATARSRRPPASGGAWLSDQLVEDLVDAGSREHYLDAALYDYEYRRRRADVTFYRQLARRRGADRILELGAGSGRVTVPLARDGRHVVAVDRSPQMLARLQNRIAHLPPAAAARITPVVGDLRSFSVPGRFPLAIAVFNVLEHLYTRGEVTACLQRIAAHLAPGGAFAFDVQLPDLAWLTRDPSKRWAKTRFTDPTTGRAMVYSTNHEYDPISQIALIRLYYEPADDKLGAAPPRAPTSDTGGGQGTSSSLATRRGPTGWTSDPRGAVGAPPRADRGARAAGADRGAAAASDADGPGPMEARTPATSGGRTQVVKLSQRKFFPAELEALVAHAGFRVVERYGDFSFKPLDASADSQVLVCEPVEKSPRKRGRSR